MSRHPTALRSPPPSRPVTRMVAVLLSLPALGGCNAIVDYGEDYNFCKGVGPLARVDVVLTPVSVRVRDSVRVNVTQRDASGNDRLLCQPGTVTWSSGDTAVAVVTEAPLGAWIRGMSAGTTTVRASVGTVFTDVPVSVTAQ